MRRALKWLGIVLAMLIVAPVMLLVGANTDPGRRAVEGLVPSLTGDTVRITGLGGRFPDALRIAQVELRDPAGAYLVVDEATVDWSPLRLLRRELAIDQLYARRVVLRRQSESSSSGSSSSLPVRVIVQNVRVDRLDIGALVAGAPAALAVEGSGALDSYSAGTVRLAAQQIDGGGRYQVDAQVDAARLHVSVQANEPTQGPIGDLAGLSALGGASISAALDGPWSAVATRIAATAGPMHANVQGTLDLAGSAADVTATITAPAMTPRPDLSWQSLTLNARVQGSFSRPDIDGHLRLERLAAAGGSIGAITADMSGNAGEARLHAEFATLRLPGSQPDLLADTPLVLDADIRLDQPDRPLQFRLQHRLVNAEGLVQTADPLQGQISLTLPDLGPLTAAAGSDLHGNLALKLRGSQQGDSAQIAADGIIGLQGGPALVGDSVHVAAAAAVHGRDVTLSGLQIDGKDVTLSAAGSIAEAALDVNWTLAVADLSVVQPNLAGNLHASGRFDGSTDNLAVTADISGAVGTPGSAAAPLTARLAAQGIPNTPSGTLTAQGTLLDAPLNLAVQAERRKDTFSLTIDRADWKSAHAEGALSLTPPATLPRGTLKFAMPRLDELAPLLGRRVGGSAAANLTGDAGTVHLTAELRSAAVPGVAAASRIALEATVDKPGPHPTINANLTLDGIAAGSVGGSATLRAQGPDDALALSLNATLPDLSGAAAQITAAARLDAQARRLDLASLQATWRQQTLRLLSPASIAFADGVSVDRLRIGFRQAVLEAAGRVSPALSLKATLRNLPADIVPDLPLDGSVNGEATLTGSSAQPAGTVTVTAKGLRLRTPAGRAVPAADISATAKLAGPAAQLDARITAGTARATVTGLVPLAASGGLDVRTTGQLDLAMLNPFLTASGRRVGGRLELNATVTGSTTAPAIAGTAQLAGGEVQDYVVGAHLTDIAARVEANGGTLRLAQMTARAGPGTLSASGSVGVLTAGMPVDLTLTARNAQPLASDLLTAFIDANLTLRGEVAAGMTVGGTLFVRRAEIRVPEKLPSSVATIPVRVAGTPPPPPPAPGPAIALDLTLDAPEQIFIRGRGLDAEVGGKVHLQGTLAQPQATGGLTLRRGEISFAGKTLTFTQGGVTFAGAGIADPGLNLVASSTINNVTATLTVGGTARKPTFTLSSSPELPQDEVLAQLLFRQRVSTLGPFELAEIAAGLASLTGAAPGADSPLSTLRKDLGLDRLSIGGGGSGNAPALEAGRYVARGVYVGAKQAVSGGGSQATVQVDIAKGLKLEATTGVGGSNSATGASDTNGSSVGLTYQFEY